MSILDWFRDPAPESPPPPVDPRIAQAQYHEAEARRCDKELRELIGYPPIYAQAYTQTMRLIEYHREQARKLREGLREGAENG